MEYLGEIETEFENILACLLGALKKSDVMIHSKNLYFWYVFDSLPPFYAQERIAQITLCSFALFLIAT